MGNLSRVAKVLLDQTSGVTATVTGATKRIRPGNDNIADNAQDYAVIFNTTMSGGASTPSITPKLQTSWDGTNWLDVIAGTAVTADGSLMEQKPFTMRLGPFVRAVATIANTATYIGQVTLISDANFTLISAP